MRNRTALITGSARRIGAYLAGALAERGYDLRLHAHSHVPQAHALAARLREHHQVDVEVHRVDLADPGAVDAWAERLRNDRPNLIVHNASQFPPPGADVDAQAMEAALRIHLLAPMQINKALSGDGHIVNILDARLGLYDAQRIDYEIAKHSLAAYTALAAKQRAPVRVNAIAPGLILPPEPSTQDLQQLASRRAVLARPATMDDLARALAFLEDSPSLTGQIIHVDAGEHLGPPPQRPDGRMGNYGTSSPA